MADYTDSKLNHALEYPKNSLNEGPFLHLEPLITPAELRSRKLWGIPLVSGWRDSARPAEQITDAMLKDIIRRMVSKLEAESKVTITPTKFKERHAFDRQEFDSFGYLQLLQRPISSVDKLSIADTNFNDLFVLPAAWLSTAYFNRGRLNIIPLSPAQTSATFSALTGTGASFGSTTLAVLNLPGNIPAYWTCEYTAGFPDMNIPVEANELISIMAAMEVLSLLAPTYARTGSHSLGIDGLSQSVSSPGAEMFQTRMNELKEEREKAMKTWRGLYGRNILVGSL